MMIRDLMKRRDLAMIIVTIIAFIIVVSSFTFIYYVKKEACNEFGGDLTGSLECAKDGVIYEMYSTNAFEMEYKVNKYPKGRGRE